MIALGSKQHGKPSNHQLPALVKARVLELVTLEIYQGFKPTLMSEKLQEIYGIKISSKTTRKLMIEANVWEPHMKKSPRVHQQRKRQARFYSIGLTSEELRLPENVGYVLLHLKDTHIDTYLKNSHSKTVGRFLDCAITDVSKRTALTVRARSCSTELPDSFDQFPQLKTLDLMNNNLTQLGDSIGKLSKLEILDLENNRFTEVPEALYQLSRNCYVRLQANPLSPEAVKSLEKRCSGEGYKGPQFFFGGNAYPKITE